MVKQLPTKLWQQVGTDLFYYDGKYYIIITDYYSLWPEVYLLKSKTATNMSDAMKIPFAHHGIPEDVVSDNGQPYSSKEYRQFSQDWQFKINNSSP